MLNGYHDESDGKRKSTRPRWKNWVQYGFILIGAFLLFLSFGGMIHYFNGKKTLVETKGMIVDFNDDRYPILEYTADGKTYRFLGNSMSSDMELGQAFDIRYDPSDPAHAHMRSSDYGTVIAVGVFGVVFTVIPVLILRNWKKDDQRREEAAAMAQYDGEAVESVPAAPVPEPTLFGKILINLFFYLGLFLLGLAALFLILKIVDWENNSFIPVLILGFIGAVHTGIGYMIRKIFRRA